ncbi:hypothetical protein C0Q70_04711 [Pomacea canaliculata]|uniref:G-protein coupled receptors family 1 profile domain-containing protein n=1 Tax=Pomacea canaliculata TaxID=400727 RepID=A0A2T7PJ49_POMCA|nr:hypothetical protein C0Q70_04711 [Pomacea canaliculata]
MEEYLTRLSMEKMMELSPSVAFLSVLIILGVPGNTLIFFIYWRYFKASSTRVFVLSMAVVDLLTSALSCSSLIIEVRFLYTFIHPSACQALFIIERLPVVTSGWLLVAVALDRRHRICQPLKRHMSPRQALYLVLVSLALASAATFPFVPLHSIVKVKTGKDHVFGLTVEESGTSEAVESTGPSTQDSCTATVSVRRHDGKTTKVSTSSHVGKRIPSRTTLMMFVLTVTAIVTYVPYVVISSLTDDGWGYCLEMKGWEMNSCMIALLFVNVNSIVNPFIYNFYLHLSSHLINIFTAAVHVNILDCGDIRLASSIRGSGSTSSHLSTVEETPEPSPSLVPGASVSGSGLRSHLPFRSSPQYCNGEDRQGPCFWQKSRNHMAPHTERQDQKREHTGIQEAQVPIQIVENDISTVMSTTTGLTVEESGTSEAVESTGPSTQDSCTATVSVGSRDGKTTKVSTRGHVGKKIPSRTTLMMFVLTVTVIVTYVPYVVISSLADAEWGYCLEMKGWEMNSCMIALLFANVNSIVNPFIYSFCNPTFRVKCRQCFAFVRQRFPV